MTPQPRPENRFRSRRLATAAAAAAATSVAGEASATIIYDITTTHTNGQIFMPDSTAFSAIEILFDAGMMGNTSISLDAPNPGMMGTASTVDFAYQQIGGTRYLEKLSPPTQVDAPPTLQFDKEAFLVRNGTADSAWQPGDTAYVGFTFQAGGTTTNYGWLQLSFDSLTSATVSQWAYQDDGSPITVGVIPEPGTALLVGLGLAVLGAAGRRRLGARMPALDD
jgi:hypothetical protein